MDNKVSQGTGVTGVNLFGLITMITTAAKHATTHRTNCEQMAGHVKMIGNLLDKLKSNDTDHLMSFPATGEPLDLLEESLRKALDLVESCREKSYLYMLAMGWSVVYQFRRVQADIDRYLKLVPLISLVHESRIQVLSFNYCILQFAILGKGNDTCVIISMSNRTELLFFFGLN